MLSPFFVIFPIRLLTEKEVYTMAINFNSGGTFNLKPLPIESVRSEVAGMLINGEEIILAFQTVRDQLVFTNKRIISIDVQGLTGRRKSYASMPYSKSSIFRFRLPALQRLFLILNYS